MAKKVQAKVKSANAVGACACGGDLQHAKLGVGWKSVLLCDKCGNTFPKESR